VGLDALHLTRDWVFHTAVQQALKGTAADITLTRDVDMNGEVRQPHDVLNAETTLTQEHTYRVFINPAAEVGVIILFLDVTDSLKAEQMRRAFTANVSHELKTPLTSISGYAEMLLTGLAKPADMTFFAGKIKAESDRMAVLVDDILFLSKLDETENRTRAYEECDLRMLSKEAMDARRELAAAAGVQLEQTGDEPVLVRANKLLLYEMLLNLIDNAIKYNIQKGLVTVDVTRENNGSCITVADTGIGIPEKHLPQVFERFYRADTSRSRKTGGTGLGLSIVKHIVQYHNGTVTIKSAVNKGTAVRVNLPDGVGE
jgi:two-component system phosphate regulon sensor histidine kinase PhoR